MSFPPILKISPPPFRAIPKNRAFHALFRVTKAMLSFDRENMTLFEFCDLCRSMRFFKRNLIDSQEWKSWFKPTTSLLNEYWQENFLGKLTLGEAKWLGFIAQRSRNLADGSNDSIPECEVLLSREETLGVMYNADEMNRVTYVSPMLVSEGAFTEGFRDSSGVCCERWAMLFLDKEHWLSRGFERYVPHFAHVPETIVQYFKNERPQNDKHKYILEEFLVLQRLLKK
jgi:hypothetical protein